MSLSLEEVLARMSDVLGDLSPIYLFGEQEVYFVSESKHLSSKMLIFLSRPVHTVFLTGPIELEDFLSILFKFIGLDQALQKYLDALRKKIDSIISKAFSVMGLTYYDYVRFFVGMLAKYFGVDPRKIVREIEDDSDFSRIFMEARHIIIEEHSKSKGFVMEWNPREIIMPPQNKIRVIDSQAGLIEYSAIPIDSEKIRVYPETVKVLADTSKLIRILIMGSYWELERRKIRELEKLAKALDSLIADYDSAIILLAKKLEKERRVAIRVKIDGVETLVGLRIFGTGNVCVFVNTGEYIVKEVVNPLYRSRDVYVYFPPVDVCIELKTEFVDGKNKVVPAGVPMMIDKYLHPSVNKMTGKRNVCLGDMNEYVSQLLDAAHDIAALGKPKKIPAQGIIISSVEQAVYEMLVTAFRVLRYGYKPGAKPHKYATDCARYPGVKVIASRDELMVYKARGVEIIDG